MRRADSGNGVIQGLGTLGGTSSQAYAINSTGQVTGEADTSLGLPRAFLYSNGVMQNLGTLGGIESIGYAINSTGQVAGMSYNNNGLDQAFLYSNGTMQDLGALGGSASVAYGINSVGDVVGYADTSSGEQAFIYSNGLMQNLNALIGTDSSLYTLNSATAINDLGQIAVNGTVNSTGQSVAFLLTPITTSSSTAVPAPGSLALLLFGMAGLVLLSRRRVLES